MLVGSVIINDCTPFEIAINEKTNELIETISKSSSKLDNNELMTIWVMIKELSKSLKYTSTCYIKDDANKCLQEINTLVNQIKKVDL